MPLRFQHRIVEEGSSPADNVVQPQQPVENLRPLFKNYSEVAYDMDHKAESLDR